ncbi:hypothetical protein [Methylobacterium sp. E-045]|uniref:hypothetical protein n=1 Tax=Methylobacterium sp. E-045 TaxID=2836575 RepID=UPI001FBB377A|nr:hypothetical protein [Methylobacterium sp. E-045]MCJ2132211.1 hypothetical protein [Methylobacterium sp. E-045]
MSVDSDSYVYDVPPEPAIDRLIRWHEGRAGVDGRLALSLEAEGLDVAATANRQRATAHRQTAQCLKALRERHCVPPGSEFRGHLQSTPRPKARVRAPP